MKAEEMRSRSTLHMNKLQEFTEWLTSKGWVYQEMKSPYEVLRMTRKGKYGNKTLIVHQRGSATEHLTTWGPSAVALEQWLKERKADKAHGHSE